MVAEKKNKQPGEWSWVYCWLGDPINNEKTGSRQVKLVKTDKRLSVYPSLSTLFNYKEYQGCYEWGYAPMFISPLVV